MSAPKASDSVCPQAHSTNKREPNSQAVTAASNIYPRVLAGIFPVALTAEPQVSRIKQAYTSPVVSTAVSTAEICPVTSTALPLSSRDHSDIAHITSKKLPHGRHRYLLATFRAAALFTLFSAVLAATDCEILNSGFPAISASECCDIEGTTCEAGRVVRLYVVSKVNSL
jgi:hypothetical protein